MRFSWFYLPLIAAVAASGPSCSVDGRAPPPQPVPGVAGPDATLEFDNKSTLELAPGEERAVSVIGSPPARYEVSFTLIGEAAGAWLDRTTVVADPSGRAFVTLHAPNLASTFRLRATIKDGPSAELGVSVSDKGFGTIRILPEYGGTREALEWTGSVKAGTTCAEIAATLPEGPEGALVATAPADDPEGVEIKSAPVGPNLAVAIRAGRAMWGCADVADLAAGDVREVVVAVKDGPLDLGATDLDLSLTFEPDGTVGALFAGVTERMLDAFLPEGGEAGALLDAMQLAAPMDQADTFAEHRMMMGWDMQTETHLAGLPMGLREVCEGWAAAALPAGPFQITARLSGISDVPGKAWLEMEKIGPVVAEDAGVPKAAHQMSWTADPGDLLRLTGTVYWVPSRFLGAAAWLGAQAEMQGVGSIGEALAGAALCEDLGAALGGYAECDAECMAGLCAAGLSARWEAALDALPEPDWTGTVAISASGPGAVNQDAVAVGWTGEWLGKLKDGGNEATVQGVVEGVASMGGPD
jgi:hypothetical protein